MAMKWVVSVSLGSSKRDKTATVNLLGQTVKIKRVGTDGDIHLFADLFAAYDGKVDCLCVGGMDVYLWAAGKRYMFRDARRLISGATRTPVVDGSGLKNTIERRTVEHLATVGLVDFPRSKVLVTCAVDRFGLAEALAETGAEIIFGDFMFGLGMGIPIRSWRTLQMIARLLLPLVVQMPFKWLYPTGQSQEQVQPKWGKYYQWADVIAGDFHFVRRYMPDRLDGKTIITNTITPEDVRDLRERGAGLLVTSTPEIDGRSFGTNVMEGIVVAVLGKNPDDITPQDYTDTMLKMGWKPRVVQLQDSD